MNTNLEVSEKVTIHVKLKSYKARVGQGVDMSTVINKWKIGSSLAGKSSLRGLTKTEERAYLPAVIGVPHDAVEFEKEARAYWADISQHVPPPDIDGKGGGLELEVGLIYDTLEGKAAAEAEKVREWKKYHDYRAKGKEYVMQHKLRAKHGTPLELEDYIIYRYCLVWKRVANAKTHMDNSTNIKFYISSPLAEETNKKATILAVRKAYTLFLDLVDDTKRMRNVLLLMRKDMDTLRAKTGEDYPLKGNTNKQTALNALATTYPIRFVAIVQDKELQLKALIERCITKGILRRIATTDRIVFGDNTLIGSNVDNAVVFLKDEANLAVRQEIEAKLSVAK